MFDIRKEVPSLELCKKLKELGYPQNNGGWYWLKVYNRWRIILDNERFEDFWDDAEEVVKAPTIRELGEWLPYKIKFRKKAVWYYLYIEKDNTINDWNVGYIDENENYIIFFGDDTEAEARAKMLLWLIENKYITFDI